MSFVALFAPRKVSSNVRHFTADHFHVLSYGELGPYDVIYGKFDIHYAGSSGTFEGAEAMDELILRHISASALLRLITQFENFTGHKDADGITKDYKVKDGKVNIADAMHKVTINTDVGQTCVNNDPKYVYMNITVIAHP